MARILEALRRADPRRSQVADILPAPRPYRPESETTPEATAEEEIPFIEVGGPARVLAASPTVLAATRASEASPAIPLRHESVPPSLGAGKPTKATDVHLVHVAFRPVPAEPSPPEPAPERFALELVAYHHPDHPISEQYRVLLAGLEAALPVGQPHVLLFTAPAPGVGTTTVLLNLAISRARQGKSRIVLLDANLRRPAVAQRLGLPTAPGLRDVLAGTVSLPRALQETGLLNLQVLTAGNELGGGSAPLAGEAMRAVLRHLRERFPLVLVDAPCWDGRPEVVALGSACDAVYLVLPQAQAESAEMNELLTVITQQGSHVRGCLLVQR
ncbi:MAG: CpsD/CapB family tyrosine-protein kinase [Gemmataceae bacterium]|nr:CpsD/CapB family tyrosine-protein kinase [Gemmataceae bacterium]